MKILPLLGLLIFASGCGPTYDHGSSNPKCVQSLAQHTGPVMIVDISIGYCLQDRKSGTAICDRTVTYKTDLGGVRQLGLQRSGTWPPVWKGAHGDIWFWIAKDALDCRDDGAVISEFDEIK